LCSAHIHFYQMFMRLADVLACSQKVSNPEMRLVNAAIGVFFPCFLVRTLVHAGFCMFPQSPHTHTGRDCRILVRFISECLQITHTSSWFIVSSKGCESHQPQVTRKFLSLLEPRTSRIGDGRATIVPLALS
jgi:uncharacterized protein YfaT (DUF1175 family)